MPAVFPLFATALVGLSMGFSLCYKDSENRLQGYEENSKDVAYWTEKAEYEKKVASGEIDPRKEASWLDRQLFALFGPKPVDVKAAEESYYRK